MSDGALACSTFGGRAAALVSGFSGAAEALLLLLWLLARLALVCAALKRLEP